MTFLSRSKLWMPRRSRSERSPEPTDPPDMRSDVMVDFRRHQPDDGEGNQRNDSPGGRRLGYTTADISDATNRRTQYSSQAPSTLHAAHGGRPLQAGTPGCTPNGKSVRPRPPLPNTSRHTQRPPVIPRRMIREEIAGDDETPSSTDSDSDSDSADSAGYAPRFRDVDVEFNHNHVEDIGGGARAVTELSAGRDLKARIHNNRFGC